MDSFTGCSVNPEFPYGDAAARRGARRPPRPDPARSAIISRTSKTSRYGQECHPADRRFGRVVTVQSLVLTAPDRRLL
ncbi:hypothetical protein TPA0910_37020 [Streptomyces hygroscopicus subsp. sporocinereus]|uniref:Uncharacterized protein n=1 Tax=Streptomyces hygroscopicus TaxID=1912 RepID=A0ABQ3U0Y2_STRHY|nr:hypothetical protein TPA0910_37020 [Streptomyces hygroscopicus]